MKTLYKIFFCTFLLITLKISAQLDTLEYLKQFEMNKAQYINQPFSKLVDDMTELQPQSLYTQIRGCNYDTQFYFVDIKAAFKSSFKINIVWQNSTSYKEEKIPNLNELCTLRDVEDMYRKFRIRNIEFNYTGDFYVTHRSAKLIEDDDPFIHLNTYLEDYKKYLINKPFSDFVCWGRPMKITRIKNIYNESKTTVLQTEFILVNPHNKRNKAKVIVDWKSPVPKNDIRDYKKKKGNRFDNNERSFYVDEIVKDLTYSAR
ncbi:hypothetical protein [Chryseobacterium luquanense]|uniref:GLPGLI family protein n=1 Tax=Chryseobacterium luquanense TaxID=2983766 RepID=A0ABT3Y214_9FLAO|nr:hypothetical protein [Chryseobacterium luquanense]MCX8532194.1 hypothetical protein [Chryseobacterium luquanense]